MEARLTTRRTRAANYRAWVLAKSTGLSGDQGQRLRALLSALPENPEPDAVSAAYQAAYGGSYDPHTLACDGCGEPHDALAEVGEEPCYESRTATLCAACLRQALALVGGP